MSILADLIKKRLYDRNQNCLVLVTGPTGSGKSIGVSVPLCREVDKEFGIGPPGAKGNRMAWMTAQNFINLLNTEPLKRGNAIIWDDCGRGLRKSDWYEQTFKEVLTVIQTFRVMGLLVVFNVPASTLISKDILKFFHFKIETAGINYEKKLAYGKVFEIEYSDRMNDTYYHYMVITKGGIRRTVDKTIFKLPHHKTVEKFQKVEAEQKKLVREDAGRTINEAEAPVLKDQAIIDGVKFVTENLPMFIRKFHKRTFLDKWAIIEHCKVGQPTAEIIKRKCEYLLQGVSSKK